jgi:hypothetical protein
MVIDDEMWSRLKKLLPKPKGHHGNDDRLSDKIARMYLTGMMFLSIVWALK